MYREWLRRGLDKQGKSAIGLAKELSKLRGKKTARSTVYAMLGTRRIRPDELAVISAYIEEPIPGFIKIDPAQILTVSISREIGAGIWFEPGIEPAVDLGIAYTRRIADLPDSDHVAFLMKGNSMVPAIPDGSTIIATKVDGYRVNGAQVIVERERGGLREISVRIIEISKDQTIYNVASDDAIYKPIVVVKKARQINETVKVIAVVQIVYIEPNKDVGSVT